MPQPFVIDRLWQGTSGQAPWQRRRGTVRSAKNARFDIRRSGANKRSATELIADLQAHAQSTFDPTDSFLWTSIRGAIIAIGLGNRSSSDVVLGWTADGTPLNVLDEKLGNNPAGGDFDTYLSDQAQGGITVDDPVRDFDVAQKYDTLIVTNRRIEMSQSTDRTYQYDESYNYLRAGDWESTLYNATATGIKVTFFTDLEDEDPEDGDVYTVQLDENLDPAGVYMYYSGALHGDYEEGYFPQHGNWFRIPFRNEPHGAYDPTRMPHRIVYDEDAGTLTIGQCNWRQRISGNQSSIREMKWRKAGAHIVAVTFHSGRLFLFSEDTVTSSRTADFFNLWVNNVNAVADDDRISQDVTQSWVGRVKRAEPAGQALFLTADNAELEYSSGDDPLTNINGRIRPIMDFPSMDIPPASAASAAIMMDGYRDLHMFTWEQGSVSSALIYTGLLTAHEQNLLTGMSIRSIKLIGTTLFVLTGADQDNLTDAEPDNAYVHDSFFVQGNMVQSAWSQLEVREPIVHISEWDQNIRLITQSPDSAIGYSLLHYRHRDAPPASGMLYQPRLDRLELIAAADISYDEGDDETTVEHTGRAGDADRSYMVTTNEDNAHEFLKAKRIDDNGNPVFAGNPSDADSLGVGFVDQYLGFTYDSEIVLAEIYPDLTSRGLNVSGLAVFHFETSDYEVASVAYPGRKEDVTGFQSHRVGVAQIGQPSLESRYKEIGVIADPRELVLTIRSSTPGQYTITAVEFMLQPEAGGKT